jgi:hypothetical protein
MLRLVEQEPDPEPQPEPEPEPEPAADDDLPQTGLAERTSKPSRLLDPEPSGKVVPCVRCGAPVDIPRITFDGVVRFNQHLRSTGQAPLRQREIGMCGEKACHDAWQAELREQCDREQRQLGAILAAIRRGQRVKIPPEVRARPADAAAIDAAFRAVRQRGVRQRADEELR